MKLSEHKKPLQDMDASNMQGANEPIRVAHVVSLIHCSRSDRMTGFLDALLILRHSIHLNSVHNSNNQQNFSHSSSSSSSRRVSKYSYQMYAIIHETGCYRDHPKLPSLLKRLGYIPLVRDTPINISEIPNEWYRTHVQHENCCGSDEFIKLYAYTLTQHPIVVHWDLDVAVLQPMDDLFDSMLYFKDNPLGMQARKRLQLQRPQTQKLPDRIDAFVTRDITSAKPWEKVQAVQGGFVVARPSLEHFERFKQFILEADYKPGRGEGSGWGVSHREASVISFCSILSRSSCTAFH